MNRLADAASLYLRQHARQPVDWYPWGDAAVDAAARRDVPLFISVGYASCHWCHVMAHESFADPEIAVALNRDFVCVKVDREEHPDLDNALMSAVQLTSGRGGWPMSVFALPDGRPFFAGTYFPPRPTGRHPGFAQIIASIAEAWRSRRGEVTDSAERLRQAIRDYRAHAPAVPDALLSTDQVAAAVLALLEDFDSEYGGFGPAPKFPPHTALTLLRRVAESDEFDGSVKSAARTMRQTTLRAMLTGGVYDQVGGGLHRYSTDRHWRLPHFEKTLYDNALLLAEIGDDPEFASFRDSLLGFFETGISRSDGLFGSALDADSALSPDSPPEEGLYYTWAWEDLPPDLQTNADFVAAFDLHPTGNYHDEATRAPSGRNVLHRVAHFDRDFTAELRSLAEIRAHHPAPAFDSKAVVGWNALAAIGFRTAGCLATADAILSRLTAYPPDRLPRFIDDGGNPVGVAALEDYAALALALALARHPEALRYLDALIQRFGDAQGGFADVPNPDALFGRQRPVFDQPVPSGNALAIRALVAAGRLEFAGASLRSLSGWMVAAPTATEGLHLALLEYLDAAGATYAPVRVSEADGWVRIDVAEGWTLPEDHVWVIGGEVVEWIDEDEGIRLRIQRTADRVTLRLAPCDASACLPVVEFRL